jgi:DNA polymerase III subunit epsilon
MYAIIDIETTGTSALFGKITEIAIFIHNGNEVTDSFTTLINPECLIPWNITRLTGISNEMVAEAPKFYEVAKQIVELTTGKIFVAHNAIFDYSFIKEEFKRLGYDYRRRMLCTVKLSRKLLPGHRSYSLGNICADMGININGRHRAAGDAFATVKLFELLLSQNAAYGINLFSNQVHGLSKDTIGIAAVRAICESHHGVGRGDFLPGYAQKVTGEVQSRIAIEGDGAQYLFPYCLSCSHLDWITVYHALGFPEKSIIRRRCGSAFSASTYMQDIRRFAEGCAAMVNCKLTGLINQTHLRKTILWIS